MNVLNNYIKEGLIDLHIHSNGSDGTISAHEIEKIAEEMKMKAYAITDHDTTIAIKGFVPNQNEILYIPGVEISAVDKESIRSDFLSSFARIHIVGLDVDIYNERFQRHMKKLHNQSIDSLSRKIKYLLEHDVYKRWMQRIPKEEWDHLLNSVKNIGAPDVALLMIKYGIVDSIDNAFKLYLKEAAVATRTEKSSITPYDAIDIIHEASGLAILAHPITLDLANPLIGKNTRQNIDDLTAYIKKLKEYKSSTGRGLDGIEVQHIHHDKQMRKLVRVIQEDYDLLESAGSDFHGSNKPGVFMGTGVDGNLHSTELPIIDVIRKRRDYKVKQRSAVI